MTFEFYKFMHLIGVILTLMALGGALVHGMNGGTKSTNQFRIGVAATHGSGLILVLIGGFGMLAKLGIMGALPIWAILKLAIWIALGGIISVIFKQPKMARSLWSLTLLLAICAAYLGIFKTF